MQRRSVINTKRRVEFGQAVLLGFEFKQVLRGNALRWQFTVPAHIQGTKGWTTGFFKTRRDAVVSALQQAEVLPWR